MPKSYSPNRYDPESLPTGSYGGYAQPHANPRMEAVGGYVAQSRQAGAAKHGRRANGSPEDPASRLNWPGAHFPCRGRV